MATIMDERQRGDRTRSASDGRRRATMRLSSMQTRKLAPPDNLLRMQRTSRSVVRRVTGRRNRMLALALWTRDGGRCRRCGLPIDPTRDFRDPLALTIGHIRPFALGGSNEPRNLGPEHRHCNLAAGVGEIPPPSSPVTP